MFPRTPPFNGIRLARLSDVPRIGVVAAASFFHSPIFAFQRPGYMDYPKVTLASYGNFFAEAILDPEEILLVLEDEYEESEPDSVYDALKPVLPKYEKGGIIVSLVAVRLQPGSRRDYQFCPEGLNPPPLKHDPHYLRRDEDMEDNYTTASPTTLWLKIRGSWWILVLFKRQTRSSEL